MKNDKWLIWSHEHQAWWRSDRNGYTDLREQAGEYSLKEAMQICENSNCWCTNEPQETILPAHFMSRR